MPQKAIRFKGINRKVNEFQSSGECEELVNMRPTGSGLEIVRPKQTKLTGVDYDVYNHVFADKSLLIGVLPENNFEIYLIDEDGDRTLIDEFAGSGPDYSVAFLGNQLLVYHNAELRAYAYQGGRYERVDASVPDDLDISYSVSTGYGYVMETSIASSDPKSNEFKEEVQKHWSAALGQNSRKDEIYGPVIVAFNLTTDDGTEFWTNKWIHANPFLSTGKDMIYYEYSDGTKRFTFDSFSIRFTIAKKQFSTSGVKNTVSKVNVYATRPVFPYNIDSMQAVTDNVHSREIHATAVGMNDSDITKQLLYYQRSIPVSKIEEGDVSFTLDFGEGQAGEKVLEVDSGPVKRAGNMVAYNNRLHVFDSYVKIYPQSVVCSSNAQDSFQERDAYVYLESNGETIVLKTTAHVPIDNMGSMVHSIACCYPDARAKKILIAVPDTSSYSTINLEPSDRYNFAWGEGKYPDTLISGGSIKTTGNMLHEANTINVSAQYNPFVFPVEYSYSLGGKILDLATSYLPISSTQVGQYPLTAFTTAGIYALEQGNGAVLYSNITPLQPLVIDGTATTTPMGTFFISGGNLYLLSGREQANLSYILNGERELYIRELDSYRRLCCNTGGRVYNFGPLLSGEDFEDFIENVSLTYDQLQNELYISSNDPAISYSYVLNLDTKSYHKISRRYRPTQNGSRYAVELVGGTANMVDLHVEEKGEQPVFLQSRPMPLEVLYTHIQRLMLLADARLTGGQYLCLSVFASDNLYDWKCIITAQKHDTALRQIRTNRAAKSYKDYIIVINGIVHSDTDISDIIADYTVVNRRLG